MADDGRGVKRLGRQDRGSFEVDEEQHGHPRSKLPDVRDGLVRELQAAGAEAVPELDSPGRIPPASPAGSG